MRAAVFVPLLLAAMLPVLGTAEARDPLRLRVGIDGTYPPFSRIEADGKPVGFDVEVARAVCERIGATCEISTPGWATLVPDLLAKKIDVVVASMPISEEAKRRIGLSAPYHRIPPRFVARADGPLPDTRPTASAGRRIGVRAGTAHAAHLEALYAPAGAKIVPYPSDADALAALVDGRVDLVFGDALSLFDLVDGTTIGQSCRFVGPAVDSPRHFGSGAGIGFRREDRDLGAAIDRALADLDRDGTLDRLAGHWFPFAVR